MIITKGQANKAADDLFNGMLYYYSIIYSITVVRTHTERKLDVGLL